MARINLLPWREELRQQRKKEFGIAIVAALAVTGALWGLYFWHVGQLIDYQTSRNDYLQSQIALLDSKIKEIEKLEAERDSLIQRMRAIETLQTSRPIIVKLFDALVSTLPEGLFLTEISQTGEKLTIKGIAQSNARVSNFMRNIEDSEVLQNPSLTVIETRMQDGRRLSDFTLVAQQTKPANPDEAGMEGEF